MKRQRRNISRAIFTACLSALLCTPISASEHQFAELQAMIVGEIVPITGRCQMAYDTGIFTNDFNNNCPKQAGTPGQYRVLATQNKLVRIKLNTFNHPGGLFTFTPTGEVKSGLETKPLVADNFTVIDSGASGLLQIFVGGELHVLSPLQVSTDLSMNISLEITVDP